MYFKGLINEMPVMSDCRSMLFNVSNKKTFNFTLPDTHSSVITDDDGDEKNLKFCLNDWKKDLEIDNYDDG